MVFSILTLFPEMFKGPFDFSMIKKALDNEIVKINLINIRDFAIDKYKTVDNRPYGGGIGMILRVDVIDRALINIRHLYQDLQTRTILMDPKGTTFNQKLAQNYAKYQHLIIICGHYEGVDARVYKLVNDVISIGNFIVTGGELPAMLVVDSVGRLVTGVLKPNALKTESFNDNSLEPSQYTRPEKYKNWSVPKTLLSGHHQKINEWKKQHSKKLRGK